MLDLDSLPATWLNLPAYEHDFESRFAALRNTDVLKLERRQTFHQPENESWMAYLNRDFDKAARMLDTTRPRLEKMFDDLRKRSVRLLRVRVVDRPITPYLHWELQALLVRAQCGEHIRVVGPDAVAHLEPEGAQTPEVVTLGDHVTYRIAYTDHGVLDGADRYLDSGLTAACTSQIHTLYSTGEDLADFFAREFPRHPKPVP